MNERLIDHMFFFFFDPEIPQFREEMRTLERALDYICERKGNLSANNLRVLIFIANNINRILSEEGLTLMKIAKEINIPYGTLSRQLDLLSEGYKSFKGLNLIERGLDKDNPKMRRLRLTDDGLQFLRDIEAIVAGRHHPLVAVKEITPLES